jgi:ribosomal protein S12 methylthiotransferase
MRRIAAPKIGFVSLGCPKALVDSERILTQLRTEGYGVSGDYAGADLVVVNTCGFIDAAVAESLDAIGEALHENGRVVVTGCLGAKAEMIRERFPRVLDISAAHQYEAVVSAVHRHLPPPERQPHTGLLPPQGVKLTPRHYAYLKVSEGCDHRCSFCIIPSLRGELQSRPIGEVLREAEALVRGGVKELLVIAQDLSAYGVDLKYRADIWRGRAVKTRFAPLVRELAQFGVWLRLHYVYPYPHVDDIIPWMAAGEVLPYLDIPFQHASPRILKLMRRPAAAEKTLDRILAWRAACPDLTLRSTFITGFPGETEAEFEELLQFLTAAQLDRVGCFAYSPVAGAAANALPDPVPEALREERRAQLMQHQAAISARRLQRWAGREMTVLVDVLRPRSALARGPGDAPEIDGMVRVRGARGLKAGEFARVRITGAGAHDLSAVPLPR